MERLFNMTAAWGCRSGDFFCIAYGVWGLTSGDPFANYYLAAGFASFIGGLVLDATKSKAGALIGHGFIVAAVTASIIPGFIATGGTSALPYIMLAGLLFGRAFTMLGTASDNGPAKAFGSAVSGITKVGGAISLLSISPPLAAILLLWTCCDVRSLLGMRTPHYTP
jgi:hypothetical protein